MDCGPSKTQGTKRVGRRERKNRGHTTQKACKAARRNDCGQRVEKAGGAGAGGGRGEERLAGGGPQRMAVSVTLGRQKKGRGKGECVGDRHAGAQRSPWAAAGVPAGEERQIMGLGRG